MHIQHLAIAVALGWVHLWTGIAQANPLESVMVIAQTPPTTPLEPSRPDIPRLPDVLPVSPSPSLRVPPATTPSPPLDPQTGFILQRVEVLGSTVFSPGELSQAIAPIAKAGDPVTFEQLLAIRTAITQLYIDRGYTTSGAFLPQQAFANGIVQIQVIEGELEAVTINGLNRLREKYVRDRLSLASQRPLNVRQIEDALQLLQQNPLFRTVRAELSAGTTPGRSVLTVTLQEAPSFSTAFLVENRDSPSVGSLGANVIFSEGNLIGWGDRLTVQGGLTQGINRYGIAYSLPLTAKDGTLNISYNYSTGKIVEFPFVQLEAFGAGISSRAQTLSIGFRQPIIRTPNNEFALGISLDLRNTTTFLGTSPFSFSLGPNNGESQVAVVRFSQDWLDRTSDRVLAARSQFSFGMGGFGATINDTGTDGRFFSWLGQFQYVQALGNDWVGIARVATQLTSSSLLPLEQFGIGGVDTVRGYRQNQVLGDNGIIGTLEVRIPIVRSSDLGTVQITPFFDIGTVWNSRGTAPSPTTLTSIGAGIRWQPVPELNIRLDYGLALNRPATSTTTLQDSGIFLAVLFTPTW